MFELNHTYEELEAFDSLLTAHLEQEESTLPEWNFMGQDVWTIDVVGDAAPVAAKWVIETEDVA